MIFLQFISEHGLDTVLIALATVILTGLLKIPIKKLASKSSKSQKITRFITFLPAFIGFGLTVLLTYLLHNKIVFDKTFFAQWLSAVSLSLAIYAFWEKFVPSESKILSEAELEANKELVEELKNKLVDTAISNATETESKTIQPDDQTEAGQAANHKKIILTNNKK